MSLIVSSVQLLNPSLLVGSRWWGLPSFSPDGTQIMFVSSASDLAPVDTNGEFGADVYIKNLITGVVTMVSTTSDGNQALQNSLYYAPVWSPDGTKVVFETLASTTTPDMSLVSANGWVLVSKDLLTGEIDLLSASGSTSRGASFSPDGTKVIFFDVTTSSVMMKNLVTDALTVVASGNDSIAPPVFSPDGTKILFTSSTTNLVSGDTNGGSDLFLKNLSTGVITRVSTTSSGAQATGFGDSNGSRGGVFSADGTKIAFISDASNLVSGDTNSSDDIFVKNLSTGQVTRVSVDAFGNQIADFSGQGYYDLAFSPDGTKLAFVSTVGGFVSGDTSGSKQDIYVKDLVDGSLVCLTLTLDDTVTSWHPSWSPDGSRIVFSSSASLTSQDTNGLFDIYVATISEGAIINGTSGRDVLNGTAGNDVIQGLAGNDTIHGLAGGDTLKGGNDDDLIYGDDGNDTLRGDGGNDRLSGGTGDDDVRGGDGNDILYGNDGNDRIEGDDGDDSLYGGNGDDALRGEIGNDFVSGGGGLDDIRGGDGNDTLYGDGGNDLLYGENGNDILYGGGGIDKLTGGTGADQFVFESSTLASNRDTIRDFNVGEGDTLVLENILVGFNPVSSAISDFVRVTESTGHTFVAVDLNGAVGGHVWQDIVRLDSVTGLGTVDDLFDSGVIVVV